MSFAQRPERFGSLDTLYGDAANGALNMLQSESLRLRGLPVRDDQDEDFEDVDRTQAVSDNPALALSTQLRLVDPNDLWSQASRSGARFLRIGRVPSDGPGELRENPNPSSMLPPDGLEGIVHSTERQINQWLRTFRPTRIYENLGISHEGNETRLVPQGQHGAYSHAQLEFLRENSPEMHQAAIAHNDAIEINRTLRQFLSAGEIRTLTRAYDTANACLTSAAQSRNTVNNELALRGATDAVGPPRGPNGMYSTSQVAQMHRILSPAGIEALTNFQQSQAAAWTAIQTQANLLSRGGVPQALDRLQEMMPANRMIEHWRRFFPTGTGPST